MSTYLLFAILALLTNSCSAVSIPNVKVYAEIPFPEGEEAIYVETVTREEGKIDSSKWKKLKPRMLLIHIDDWAKIKKSWMTLCRKNQSTCNINLESSGGLFSKIDSILGAMAK